MGSVDEGLGQVQFAALPKVLGQRGQYSVQCAFSLPLLKTIVTCLIGRIAMGEIVPRSSRPQDPKYPVEHVPRIPPRPSSSRRRALPLRLGNAVSNRFPLRIGEVHRRWYKHISLPMEMPFRKMEQYRSLTPHWVVGCVLVMRRHKGRTSVAHRGASSNELPPTIRCRCMAMFADECVLKSVEEFFHGAPPACGSVVSPATTRFFVFGSRTDASYPGHRPGEPAGRAVGQNCWQHVYG